MTSCLAVLGPSSRRTSKALSFSRAALGLLILVAISGPVQGASQQTTPTTAPGPSPSDEQTLLARLQSRHQPAKLQELLLRLEDRDSLQRWLAADELALSGRLEAVPHLVNRLTDPNLEVGHRAFLALTKLARPGTKPFLDYLAAGLNGAAPTVINLGRALTLEITGANGEARAAHAQAFAQDHRFLWSALAANDFPELLTNLKSTLLAQSFRAETLLAIPTGTTDRAAQVENLRQAYALVVFHQAFRKRLNETAGQWRRAGRVGPAQDLENGAREILQAGQDLDRKAKRSEQALKKSWPAFTPSDLDPVQAESAARAHDRASAALELASLSSSRSVPVLIQALRDDPAPMVRMAAAEALGRRCDQTGIAALQTSVERDSHLEVRQASLQALGCRDLPTTRALIQRLIGQPEYRWAAYLALGRLGTPADVARIEEAGHQLIRAQNKDQGLSPEAWEAEDGLEILAVALELSALKAAAPEAIRLRRQAEALRRQAEGGD